MQQSDDHSYSEEKRNETEIPYVLRVCNPRFREMYAFLDLDEPQGAISLGDSRYASAYDITVKDVTIFCDEDFVSKYGKRCASIRIDNRIPTTVYKNIVADGIYLNGKRISADEMAVRVKGTDDSVLAII